LIEYNSNKNLLRFFLITLLWTWIAGFIPVILGIADTAIGNVIFYFGGGAPSVVALFLVFKTYQKEARREYFNRCFSLKNAGVKWPIWTILFFSAITVIGIYIGVVLCGYEMPEMQWIRMAIEQPYIIPLLLFFSIISGPLNEEFGWRGYSLDRLLVRFGFMRASFILGFIWAIWHLAWYFTPGQAQYDLLQSSLFEAFMFIPSTIAVSFVVSFVYINSKRSILAGAFVHMTFNFLTSQLLAPYSIEISSIIRNVTIVFSVTVIVYCLCAEKFKGKVQWAIEDIKKECEKYGFHQCQSP